MDNIELILAGILELLKKQYPASQQFSKVEGKLQEFHPTYLTGVKNYKKIRPHAVPDGEFPEALFIAKHPNMDEKEYDYIKGNYKQTTLSVYDDFLSTVRRMWADGGWSITYSEDASTYSDNTFQSYVEKGIQAVDSLENFMKFIATDVAQLDAEGVIAVKILKEAEENTLYEPQPVYYRCDQVLSKEEGEYFMILLDERSEVEYGNSRRKMGFVLEYYDRNAIYRITQVGKYTDFNFDIEVLLQHDWGKVPCFILKGNPFVTSGKILYCSPFVSACDNLDLALMNAQYLQASTNKTVFPIRVMVGDKCSYSQMVGEENVTCSDGYLRTMTETVKCPSCKGTGHQSRLGALSDLILNRSDWSGEGDKVTPANALFYVTPETAALQFLKDKVATDMDAARKILHLQTSNSEVKGTENLTATGMAIDNKAMFAFVRPISDRIFDLYENLLDAIGWIRYGAAYNRPVLVRPNTFDFYGEEEYVALLKASREAELPPSAIHNIIQKYFSTLYANEATTAQAFDLIVNADRLLAMSNDSILLDMSKGLVEKWEKYLYDSGFTLVKELVSTTSDLFDKPMTDQIQLLHELAKKKADMIKSPNQTVAANVVGNILNAA